MQAAVGRPTPQDQQVALESLPVLNLAIAQKRTQGVSIQIRDGSRQASMVSVVIPEKALHLLAMILSSMAQGKAVSLVPADSELSTQQAADLLHVSRPHLVKLLEAGSIPFKKVGTHRRILVEDVLQYQDRQKGVRNEQLQFLTGQAQDLNLGYE